MLVLPTFQRVQLVEQARRRKAERGRGLPRGPDIHQPVQGVLLLLQTELVPRGARGDTLASPEAAALVADHRLHRGEKLGRRHQPDGHARATEDRLDDVAVAVAGDDHAVLHGVPADDPAGGHAQAEDRVARRGELVDQLLGGRPPVEHPGVGLLQDHHAAALDPRVGRVHGGGHEVGEAHVGDEPPALVHLEHRLLPVLPFGHANLAPQQARLDADVGQGFGEAEGAAPDLAILAGLGWDGVPHVRVPLLRRAALVDGGEAQIPRQTAGGGAGVHPGQLEGDQRHRQILGTLDKPSLRRIHEERRDPGLVEGLQELGLLVGPFVGVACSLGHQPGHRAAGHGSRGLDQHLQVVPVGKPPQDLPDVVSRQGAQDVLTLLLRDRFHEHSPPSGLGKGVTRAERNRNGGRTRRPSLGGRPTGTPAP